MRFRAEQRLRRQQDFRTARERGRRIDCGGFTLWYVRRFAAEAAEPAATGVDAVVSRPRLFPVPANTRVGVVASTAAVGCAVERNRAKRRLREVFRKNQTLVPADADILLVARHSLNRLEFAEIQRKFIEACKKAFPA